MNKIDDENVLIGSEIMRIDREWPVYRDYTSPGIISTRISTCSTSVVISFTGQGPSVVSVRPNSTIPRYVIFFILVNRVPV